LIELSSDVPNRNCPVYRRFDLGYKAVDIPVLLNLDKGICGVSGAWRKGLIRDDSPMYPGRPLKREKRFVENDTFLI